MCGRIFILCGFNFFFIIHHCLSSVRNLWDNYTLNTIKMRTRRTKWCILKDYSYSVTLKIYQIWLADTPVGVVVSAMWLVNVICQLQTQVHTLPAVRLFSLSYIVTCFSTCTDKEITPTVSLYSQQIQRRTHRETMSKDNRHDGRRRGAAQHRVGPRSQGLDGRERSGSNSSGSSHGGGRNKNSPLSALKVPHGLWDWVIL